MEPIKKATRYTIFGSLFTITFLLLMVSASFSQSADDDFSGNWKSEQGPLVEITKSGNTFKGVNIEHDKLVLENLKFVDDEWTGTLIKPQDGSKYNCTAVLDGKKLRFNVKKGLFSKTIVWTKQ